MSEMFTSLWRHREY